MPLIPSALYQGIGIGYGDGVVDNDAYMRRFVYYNNGNNPINGSPPLPPFLQLPEWDVEEWPKNGLWW